MVFRSVLSGFARFLLLVPAFFACFVIPTFLIPFPQQVQGAANGTDNGLTVLVYLLLFSAVSVSGISYAVLIAHARGLKLMGALLITVFGFQTFMLQIETYIFRSAFPALGTDDILKSFLRGLLSALLFIPLAVIVWKKLAPDRPGEVKIPWRAWLWKVPVLGVVYVVMYFMFGYFVAWQHPDVRLFYTGTTEIRDFPDHLAHAVTDTPWFIPFQFLRGILWVGFATPLILVLAGRRWHTTLILAVLSCSACVLLLLPNPLMPEAVRMAHFVETLPSMAFFGALLGFVLTLAPKGSP